jgi:hypothetical protein
VLLTGAGLLIRSLSAVQSVESGFGDRGVVTSHLRFHNALQRQRRVDLYQEATERMRRLPGVRAVGAVGTMFWNGEGGKFGLRTIDGHPDKPRDQWEALTWTTICGDYFQALGVPLLRGRFFQHTDTRDAAPVVLINETTARRYWPGDNPVGRRIKGFDARGTNDDWVTVIGVVKDVHSQGLERGPIAQIFEAQSQSLMRQRISWFRGQRRGFLKHCGARFGSSIGPRCSPICRRLTIASASKPRSAGSRPICSQRSRHWPCCSLRPAFLRQCTTGSHSGPRRSAFAWHSARSGVRCWQWWLRETFVLAVAGVGVGVGGALVATRTIASVLFGVTPHDPVTFAAVSLGMTATAMIASYVPAARAARIDPILALKIE